jgi:hypothetical protein
MERGAEERLRMRRVNFVVMVDELRLLASLASDQLFRRQFIDPRFPAVEIRGNPMKNIFVG